MDSRLLKSFKKAEDKNQFAAEYKVSQIREKLEEIISTKIEEKSKSSVEDYKLPAWAYYKADQEGYLRALKEVLQILTIK